jgi:hypothetical protein
MGIFLDECKFIYFSYTFAEQVQISRINLESWRPNTTDPAVPDQPDEPTA